MKHCCLIQQDTYAGFSLLDLLFALAIASVGITGLLRYHQTLLFQFNIISQSQQAWRIAGQLLEIYPEPPPVQLTDWHYSVVENAYPNLNHTCAVVVATVKPPHRAEVQLERLICWD